MSTIRRFLKGMTIASVATFLVCGLSAQAEEFCETEMIEILTQTRSVLMNSDEPDLIQAVRNASAAKNDCSDNPEALALAVSVYNWSAYQFEGDGNRMMLYSIGLETALMREALVTEASREDEAGEDMNAALLAIVRELLVLTESQVPHEMFIEDASSCPYPAANNYRVRMEAGGLLGGVDRASSASSDMYDWAEHRLANLAAVCPGHQRYATEALAMLHHHRARAFARESNPEAQRDELRLAASFMNASLSMESEGHYVGTMTRIHQEIQDELAGRN
ncbi:hypothetical protein [Ponticaulis sp.]|uniref:hypothetical protein n=1 Tax=Ponticaulis sp. TaxID=2020902 RepID=UPI000C54C182|nr:hypothetical protein [Ponticaulis sp.]MBN06029.1 hypothetical protein [Ponticaulis sp.]